MSWMRQKNEPDLGATTKLATPSASTTSKQQSKQAPSMTTPSRTTNRETTTRSSVANVGTSVQIKGELTGNEDLIIEGRVEGQIRLAKHELTIGSSARINAELSAKTVLVLGEVHGNIVAEEMVQIAASGSLEGDITAPRVSIADGARFRGKIDMSGAPAANQAQPTSAAAKESKAQVAVGVS